MIHLSLHRTHYPHAAHNEVRVNVVTFSDRRLVCFQSAHMFAGGIIAENMGGIKKKKREREREGQYKGFSRQTNGVLDCSDTATGHTLPVTHTHFYTQAPLDQMTASELGGMALASLSLCFLFLPAQPGPKTRTHTTTHPEPDVAPGLNQAGLVCPPNTLLHTHARGRNQLP